MQQGKVLVMGDDTRSFLAIVRSLGRRGIEVHAAPADFTSPALASRYITQIQYLPPWAADADAWRDAVEALLRAERFDLVIPCSEPTLLPLQRDRERFGALTRLAIPDDRSIAALFDKHATRELARSVGAHVAPGGLAEPTDQAAEVFARFGTPLVLKPRRSYTVDNLDVRGRVRICRTPAALDGLLPDIRAGDFFYEAFVPGRGVGLSVLASQGRVLQFFEHHRVREDESGSYYRVSAPPTPALKACCTDMVAALGYTGIAMFEFRVGTGPDDWVLLEVNARPWGSMPLPVSLGVDFPFRWFQLLTAGTETPPVAYRMGVYGRNLIPDLYSTLSEIKAGPGGIMRIVAGRAGELGRLLAGRERQDTLVRDDVKPGLQELRAAGVYAAGRLARLSRLARLVPAGRSLARARTRAALQRVLKGRGQDPVSLVFVCQGNICRSPFAAAVLRQAMHGKAGARVGSAGLLPRPGRPTPAFGIEAAAARGIDLQPHRSSFLSREDAESADAIVIFDDTNRQWLRRRYPGLKTPVLKLGHLAPATAGIGDIADPVDSDLPGFAAIYDEIICATAGLAELLAQAHAPQP